MTENEKIDNIVDNLGCSISEAKDLMEYDKAVDKAKAKDRLKYDLSLEEEKKAKKYANVTEHKTTTVYKWDKRPRKENATKKGIIAELNQFLTDNGYENIDVVNAERQILFTVGDKKYELTLVEKRKPKTAK